MKKKTNIVVTIFCLVVVLLLGGYTSFSRSATVTILEDGRPVANVALTALPSLATMTTDLNGTVECDGKSQAIMVPKKGGGVRVVKLPERGSMTVHFQGNLTTTTMESRIFGIYSIESVTEQFDLTDEQVSAVEQGTMSLEQVQQIIRNSDTEDLERP